MRAYLKLIKYLLVSFLLFNASQLWAETFVAGKDYQELSEPSHLKSDIAINSKTVIEFFNPACSVCYSLEPTLNTWLTNKPRLVKFIRVPVIFNRSWELYAKAYLLSEELFSDKPDEAEKFLVALFDGIQNSPTRSMTERQIAALFQKFGVDEKIFDIGYKSLVLDKKLRQAKDLTATFKIMSVPAFIVAGRYRTGPDMIENQKDSKKTWEHLMKVVDYLLEEANSPQSQTQSE